MSPRSRTEVVRHAGAREQILRVWEGGDACRALLVIVHGYAEHSGRYEHVGARLAGAGIAVWATDLRGHGLSSGERVAVGSLDDLVADAALAVDRARAAHPGKPAFLLGHSMGGLVATRLYVDVQGVIEGLVLSGGALGDPAGIEPLLELDPLPEIALSSELLSRDPEVARAYDEDPLVYRGPFRRDTLATLARGAREVRGRWHAIAGPILVLHGGDDAIVPALSSEELCAAAASRDKQLEVYPGLRHEILNEPEGPEIVDRIAGWILERADRASSAG
jgi:alpha-beta hydrolase superfamily lysophospholipase